MPQDDKTDSTAGGEFIQVDLRQREVAGFYAWLWPGGGHIYQRRYAKGFLFMVCILSTFYFGLGLGGGRVVYAKFERGNFRWQYALQAGVGLPALPAVIQSYRAKNPNTEPYFHGWMAPPEFAATDEWDELAEMHETHNIRFELGTLYTVVAGLLNILAIYDACCGPMLTVEDEEESEDGAAGEESDGTS